MIAGRAARWRNLGPGWLVTAAFIGPGTVTSATVAGARFGTALLWALLFSTAGVLETRDGGKSWRSANKGMLNDYLPDPQAEWGHDPHFVTLCPAQPDHVWQQNHSGVFYSDDGAANWRKVSALLM